MDEHARDEHGSGVVQPDTLLASQYFDRVRRRAAQDGERRLMIAILEDAVHAYLKYAAHRHGLEADIFREAEEWVESRESAWLYSFENVCAVLDLGPEYLRRGLRAWKTRARDPAARREPGRPAGRERDDDLRPACGG